MNKVSIFFLAIFTSTLFSCSNEDDATTPPEDEANYFALTVGNSWTYNVYQYNNATESYNEMNLQITNTITGTETTNGETYFIYEATSIGADQCQVCLDDLGNKSVRDSLGYLVDASGIKRFTVVNETPYLLFTNDIGSVFGEFNPNQTSANTPDGMFTDLDTNTYYLKYDNGSTAEGRDANYYREGEGLIVKEISFSMAPNPKYILTLSESIILTD